MRSRATQFAALWVAITLGTAVGAATNGCLLPEDCILTISHGENWCTYTLGALMWPPGQPELAVPVLYEHVPEPPQGCGCYNAAEQEILWARVPAESYEGFRMEVMQATRDECDFVVPPGWDHNCYLEGPEGIDFAEMSPRDYGDCVGACHYLGPKCPEPGEVNPYECEELYGAGETGSVEETGAGETTGPPPGEEDTQWKL